MKKAGLAQKKSPEFESGIKRDANESSLSKNQTDRLNRISLSPDKGRKRKVMNKVNSSAIFLLDGEGRINHMKKEINEMHDLSSDWFKGKNKVVQEKCENMYIHGTEMF